MAEQIQLRIFTPEGGLIDEVVTSATLPTAVGQVTVLPGHASYVGSLGTGILEYTSASTASTKRLVTTGGFASMTAGVLTILADSADTIDSIDQQKYGAERSQLKAAVDTGNTFDPEWGRAQQRLQRIEAIDDLIGRQAH